MINYKNIPDDFTLEVWDKYSNKDLCEIFDVSLHTLRQWKSAKGYPDKSPRNRANISRKVPKSFTLEKFKNTSIFKLCEEYEKKYNEIWNWSLRLGF